MIIPQGKFRGCLEPEQKWVKGKTERTIVAFNGQHMWYRSKDKVHKVSRNTFRRWLYSGAGVVVGE